MGFGPYSIMNISEVILWDDVGFQDGAVEVPSLYLCETQYRGEASTIPNKRAVYTDVTPSKGRWFNEFKLKGRYTDLMNVSYLRMKYDNKLYFGWVDSVELMSDTVIEVQGGADLDFSEVLITWHIDYWRTYAASAEYGSGRVVRIAKDKTSTHYPQTTGHIYRKESSSVPLGIRSATGAPNVAWIIIPYTSKEQISSTPSSNVISYSAVVTFPVELFDSYDDSVSNLSLEFDRTGANPEYAIAMKLGDVITGAFDDALGLIPEQIQGVYLSPVPPFTYHGTGTDSSPIKLIKPTGGTAQRGGVGFFTRTSGSTKIGAFWVNIALFDEFNVASDFPTIKPTDEERVVAVTDLFGNIAGTFPFGVPVESITARVVVAGTDAYVQVRTHGKTSSEEGMAFNVPLPSFQVTSNAWSSYLYSGEREYTIEQRKTQNLMALAGGITGAATGGAQGAMAAQIRGGASAATTGSLAALGMGVQAGTSLVQYEMNKYLFNDRLQNLEDSRKANQAEGLIVSSGCNDFIFHGYDDIRIVELTMDSYSLSRFNAQIDLNGYEVNFPLESADYLLTTGEYTGPIQIADLIVGGHIPVEARVYIKAKFDAGIRMIGSTPVSATNE